MPKYIDDYIPQGGSMLVEIIKYGEQKTAKNGKFYTPVRYKIPSTSEIVDAAIFEGTLNFELGGELPPLHSTLELTKNGKFIKHKLTSAENPASSTSYHQVKTEREVTKIIHNKDLQISLQGFMQAFIIQGKTADEALRLSITARQLLLDYCMEDKVDMLLKLKEDTITEPPKVVYASEIDVEDLPF